MSCFTHRKLYQINDQWVSCETSVDQLTPGGEADKHSNSTLDGNSGSSNNIDCNYDNNISKPKKVYRVCLSGPCRTKWRTGSLTLKCHYCKFGWLINHQGSSFVCHACQKTFESLEFIEKQCDEQMELFQFWYDDLLAKDDHPLTSLNMMKRYFDQLDDFIESGNIRKVTLNLNMAKAHRLVGDHLKASEYNHRAIRLLLDYEFDFVADKSKLKSYLEEVVDIASKHQSSEKMAEDYIDDVECLAERIRLLYN